ncbi:hypothetical protein D3C72_678510 [compost metagenome]
MHPIVGMNGVRPARATHLIQGLAGELAPLRHILHHPRGACTPDELRIGPRKRLVSLVAASKCQVIVHLGSHLRHECEHPLDAAIVATNGLVREVEIRLPQRPTGRRFNLER